MELLFKQPCFSSSLTAGEVVPFVETYLMSFQKKCELYMAKRIGQDKYAIYFKKYMNLTNSERDDVAKNVVFSFNGSHLLSYLLKVGHIQSTIAHKLNICIHGQ